MKNLHFFAFALLLLPACKPANDCIGKRNPDCLCTEQYDPVCGCNNKTYGNACVATCEGVKTYTKGRCPQPNTANITGKTWQLTALMDGEDQLTAPDNVKSTIQLDHNKVAGNGGCNRIGGSYVLEGNKLTFSELFSTKMFCEPASNWENKFLLLLAKSESFVVNGNVLAVNCGASGELTFAAEK